MDEVALALAISVPSVYGLINDRLLKTFLIGRRRFASPRAIQECVELLEEQDAPLPRVSGLNYGHSRAGTGEDGMPITRPTVTAALPPISEDAPKRFIKLPAVQERTALSETRIWELEQAGEFPRRVRLSTKATGWLEHEVVAWIEKRVALSRAPAGKRPRGRPPKR